MVVCFLTSMQITSNNFFFFFLQFCSLVLRNIELLFLQMLSLFHLFISFLWFRSNGRIQTISVCPLSLLFFPLSVLSSGRAVEGTLVASFLTQSSRSPPLSSLLSSSIGQVLCSRCVLCSLPYCLLVCFGCIILPYFFEDINYMHLKVRF